VARRGMAHARAGVDIVVAESGPDQLLNEVSLLVRATRTGDAADRAATVLRLNPLEFGCRVGDRFIPRNLTPGIRDRRTDHRIHDAILVGRVAPGEAALYAGMSVIRLSFLRRRHAHDPVALHFGIERTTHT